MSSVYRDVMQFFVALVQAQVVELVLMSRCIRQYMYMCIAGRQILDLLCSSSIGTVAAWRLLSDSAAGCSIAHHVVYASFIYTATSIVHRVCPSSNLFYRSEVATPFERHRRLAHIPAYQPTIYLNDRFISVHFTAAGRNLVWLCCMFAR